MVSYTSLASDCLSRLQSLNPYCSGQWSRTECFKMFRHLLNSLNPYCSGQWSRTNMPSLRISSHKEVLILVVVDNGIVLYLVVCTRRGERVLILVVVDNGIVQFTSNLPQLILDVLILIVVDNGLVPGRTKVLKRL